MKKYLLLLVVLAASLNLCFAQADKSISIGLKDNRFATAGFAYNQWQVGLKHSIFSEDFKHQYFQFNVGYKQDIQKYVSFEANAYSGTVYNGKYYTVGADVVGTLHPFNRLDLYAQVRPHYDSGMKYKTYWGVGAIVKIIDEISAKVNYDNIPEYRVSEKRVKVGAIFNSKNISVSPEIAIPVQGSKHKVKVLCSFAYTFTLSKK